MFLFIFLGFLKPVSSNKPFVLLASETAVLSRSYICVVIQKNAYMISISHLSVIYFKMLSIDAEKKKNITLELLNFKAGN